MKKKITLSLIGVFCFLFFMSKIAYASEKVILIDPGHGGIDGGAVSSSGVIEKDVNLSIGLKLKEVLEDGGYKVYMTRDEDKGLYTEGKTIREKKREDLASRVKLKNSTDADIFISIHQNTFPEAKYKGMQVWYAQNSPDSKALADLMQASFKESLDSSNVRMPKDAGTQFRVIRNPSKAASVIVECGFLSNPDECVLLVDESYQKDFADILKISVDNFYEMKNRVEN
ncbi:N-acetylmuramoyl-L-alanine amidase CwlD [uncultured Clostridium sp.]|uniref:N-acetylmuramoyl-L-alanine amidase CwlD n=1 Tax=uncultured Clostridium sp. TaxID=59620 RepID=UPI0026233ACA|nr:N-acetylmuramoyl-L-alanine amidase CwlD [uncultured Clostridium sp.]